jgi:hypothetical protein
MDGYIPINPHHITTFSETPQVISEINGQNPRELLMPLLHGPHVPGNGQSMAGTDAETTETGCDPLTGEIMELTGDGNP